MTTGPHPVTPEVRRLARLQWLTLGAIIATAGLLEELVIHWPGGEVTEVGDVPADHTVTVGVDGSVAVQPPGPGSGK